MRFTRRIVLLGSLLGFVGVPDVALASDVKHPPDAAPTIAVVPFVTDSGDGDRLRLADRLVRRRAERPRVSVQGPLELEAPMQWPPVAREVRGWAERTEAETVVVGRVQSTKGGASDVVVDIRSGHSGAAIARQHARIEGGRDEDLVAAIEGLAAGVLAVIGYDPSRTELPPVAAAAATRSETNDSGSQLELGKPRNDAPIEIRSGELEMIEDENARHIIFIRDVRVVQGDVTLETDRLEAFYPAGSSQPERLLARGNVRIQQNDRRARCDSADYIREDQQIVCRGHAELVEGCDHVRGEEIFIDLDGDRARVTGAPSLVIYPEGSEASSCPESTP